MRINLPPSVEQIIDMLAQAGYAAYAVGGCVRDALLEKIPHDWDICTAATPDEMKQVFSEYRVLDTGLQHGTLTVLLDNDQYEITTFRVDGAYSDGRRPDSVAFVTNVEADLGRRDFTVNAMAYNPRFGLIDPFGGQQDLLGNIIRCVGDPDARFHEDGLRIMRAIRFASVLGFGIQRDTGNSIHRNKALLDRIAKERIHVELSKLLMGDGAKDMLLAYSDVLSQIIPQVGTCIEFEQNNPHHKFPVWEHTAEAVSCAPKDLVVRLTMLLHDIGKPESFTADDAGTGHFYGHADIGAEMAKLILRNLKYDNDTIKSVASLVQHHDVFIAPTARSVRRWLNKLGNQRFAQLLEVKRADAKAQANPEEKLAAIDILEEKFQEVMEQQQCFTFKDLAVDGHDIMELGIAQGHQVGEALRFALDQVMEDRVPNEKGAIIRLLKAWDFTNWPHDKYANHD